MFQIDGVSIFSLCETLAKSGLVTSNNRTLHVMSSSAYKGDYAHFSANSNIALIAPDPNSMALTPTVSLAGFKLEGVQFANAAALGARPQCRSSNVTNGAPIGGAGGRLLYSRSSSSTSDVTFSITRTATTWTFDTTVVNGTFQECFVELQGAGGGGSCSGATAVGYRGQGAAAGGWALARIRLDVGGQINVTVGGYGAGDTAASGGSSGRATSIIIGSESLICNGGPGGVWGGYGSNGSAGGNVTGTTNGTYVKLIHSKQGNYSINDGNSGIAVSISTNDNSPESNSVGRNQLGSAGGSSGGGGASSPLGVGGAGGSSGGNGNPGGGYGSGGAGGRRGGAVDPRYNGGNGAPGWVGFWY